MKSYQGWKGFVVLNEFGKFHLEKRYSMSNTNPMFFETEESAKNYAVDGETVVEIAMIPLREIRV